MRSRLLHAGHCHCQSTLFCRFAGLLLCSAAGLYAITRLLALLDMCGHFQHTALPCLGVIGALLLRLQIMQPITSNHKAGTVDNQITLTGLLLPWAVSCLARLFFAVLEICQNHQGHKGHPTAARAALNIAVLDCLLLLLSGVRVGSCCAAVV